MSESNEVGWSEIARYVAGEMTPAEVARFEVAIARDPESAALVDQARAVWREAGRAPASFDAERALSRIKAASRARATPALEPIAAKPSWMRWGWIAAGTGVAAAAVLFLTRADQPSAPPAPAWTQLVTKRSQRAELRLPEGTRVILGVDSRLRYPERFGAGARQVRLEGEAYFEVEHDPLRPFEVIAGPARIRNLGTTFTVTNRPAAAVEVAVAEGQVALGPAVSDGDSLIIHPAELGRLTPDGRLERRNGIDLSAHLGWTEGRLVFVDTPLAEVVASLSRWYDVDVRLDDSSLAKLPLTATFTTEPVGQALDVIASSLRLRYEPRGSTIRLFRRR